jgi:hypothetical protein
MKKFSSLYFMGFDFKDDILKDFNINNFYMMEKLLKIEKRKDEGRKKFFFSFYKNKKKFFIISF